MFQMTEVGVPQQMVVEILSLIARLRAPAAPGARGSDATGDPAKVCLDAVKAARSAASMPPNGWLERRRARSAGFPVVEDAQKSDSGLAITENPGSVGLNSPERCLPSIERSWEKNPEGHEFEGSS
jgi:hypothetical protein